MGKFTFYFVFALLISNITEASAGIHKSIQTKIKIPENVLIDEALGLHTIMSSQTPANQAKFYSYSAEMLGARKLFRENRPEAIARLHGFSAYNMSFTEKKFLEEYSKQVRSDFEGFKLSSTPSGAGAAILGGVAITSLMVTAPPVGLGAAATFAYGVAAEGVGAAAGYGLSALQVGPSRLPEVSPDQFLILDQLTMDAIHRDPEIGPMIVDYGLHLTGRDLQQSIDQQPEVRLLKSEMRIDDLQTHDAELTAQITKLLKEAEDSDETKKENSLQTSEESTNKTNAVIVKVTNNFAVNSQESESANLWDRRSEGGFDGLLAIAHMTHASPTTAHRIEAARSFVKSYREIANSKMDPVITPSLYLTAASALVSLMEDHEEGENWNSLFQTLKDISAKIDALKYEMRAQFFELDIQLAQKFYAVKSLEQLAIDMEANQAVAMQDMRDQIQNLQTDLDQRLGALGKRLEDVNYLDCTGPLPMTGATSPPTCAAKSLLLASIWSRDANSQNTGAKPWSKSDISDDSSSWIPDMYRWRGFSGAIPNPRAWMAGASMFLNVGMRYPLQLSAYRSNLESKLASISNLKHDGESLQRFYRSAVTNSSGRFDDTFLGAALDHYAALADRYTKGLDKEMHTWQAPIRGSNLRLPEETDDGFSEKSPDAYPFLKRPLSLCPDSENFFTNSLGSDYIRYQSVMLDPRDSLRLPLEVLNAIPRKLLWLERNKGPHLSMCIDRYSVAWLPRKPFWPNIGTDFFIISGYGYRVWEVAESNFTVAMTIRVTSTITNATVANLSLYDTVETPCRGFVSIYLTQEKLQQTHMTEAYPLLPDWVETWFNGGTICGKSFSGARKNIKPGLPNIPIEAPGQLSPFFEALRGKLSDHQAVSINEKFDQTIEAWAHQNANDAISFHAPALNVGMLANEFDELQDQYERIFYLYALVRDQFPEFKSFYDDYLNKSYYLLPPARIRKIMLGSAPTIRGRTSFEGSHEQIGKYLSRQIDAIKKQARLLGEKVLPQRVRATPVDELVEELTAFCRRYNFN